MPSSRPAGLGIDLGTSHTVAVVRRRDGRVQSLLFDSSPLLPSAVFVSQSGAALVGSDALHSAKMAPARLEPHPKRRIDDGTVLLGDREWTIPELFAAVLSRVRRECVQVLGEIPSEVVITHPAVWGPTRRSLLRKACAAAGFEDVGLVPEPVAAAHYFVDQLGHEVPVGASIVVHDFGGGTFDAAVLTRTITGFTVSSLDGLDQLGGTDIDAAIVADLRGRVGDPEDWAWYTAPQTTADRRARHNFIEDVRLVKERLSRHPTADLYLPILDRDVHLTREELETLAQPLLSRAVDVVEAVIEDSGVPDLAGIFPVGGASRMPLVATLLHRRLGVAPIVVDQLEQVVAHGALLSGKPEAVGFSTSAAATDRASEAASVALVSGDPLATVADPVVSREPEATPAEAAPVDEMVEAPTGDTPTPTHPPGDEPAEPVGSHESDGETSGLSRPSVGRRSILVAGVGTIAALAAIPLVMALNQEDDPVKADDAPADGSSSSPPRPDAQGWSSQTLIADIATEALAFSPSGDRLAVGRAGAVEIWDVDGGHLDTIAIGDDNEWSYLEPKLEFSPDGKLLAVAGRDHVSLWDVDGGTSVTKLEVDTTPAFGGFSSDGSRLAFSDGKVLKLWDVATESVNITINALVATKNSHDINQLAFSSDGALLASRGWGGSSDAPIEVWDVSSGRRVTQLANGDGSGPMAFNPDASLLAASVGITIHLWDTSDWSRAALLKRNRSSSRLEFSPDGATLMTDGISNMSHRIDLWDVASRQRTRDDLFHSDLELTALTFSPDGEIIASGGSSSVELWRRE
ncbi:WD domain G-beta repeat uncharacterized protein [Stackebrandtia endophytica]|uniref:WD domain G-beta repeat uncharacterized protein n=1 Tax=Stackebrandtia endophytica TaxID=1496996 RepID=A0A543ATI9_9ACTN|nr:Hsp70 family protein [Stackebrandtia endophytica]TQL75888.1 WD domain G-beta repeat uncharacterized protein [Stackebrandtia endophytica]